MNENVNLIDDKNINEKKFKLLLLNNKKKIFFFEK